MKKKYTNQASKYHGDIYSEGGDKSKSSPNFNGRYDDVQSKKLEPSSTRLQQMQDEDVERRWANSPDTIEPDSMRLDKEKTKNKYEKKDTEFKNNIEKIGLQAKIRNYEAREKKMGGSKAVTKKIKRREWYKKNAADIRTGAGIAAGGTYATFKKEIDNFVGNLFKK